MEVKEFVKKILIDLVDGVEGARADSAREMRLSPNKESAQTVEFDIAVTVENSDATNGGAGITVLSLIQAGAEIKSEVKNSSVSRIKFGVHIDPITKAESARINSDAQSRILSNRANQNSSR